MSSLKRIFELYYLRKFWLIVNWKKLGDALQLYIDTPKANSWWNFSIVNFKVNFVSIQSIYLLFPLEVYSHSNIDYSHSMLKT